MALIQFELSTGTTLPGGPQTGDRFPGTRNVGGQWLPYALDWSQVVGALGGIYAPLVDARLSGNPTAPTATVGTATTQLATCAFVMAAVGQAGGGTITGVTPGNGLTGGGTSGGVTLTVSFAGSGSATTVARSDHTHSYLPLGGGTLTGTLVLPADPANPLEAATKQYVDNHAGSGGGVTINVVKVDGSTIPGSTTTPYQMLTNDLVVDVNKTTGAASKILLPTAPLLGRIYTVIDGKGDAQTNTIAITAANGTTINGTTQFVLDGNNYSIGLIAITSTVWRLV